MAGRRGLCGKGGCTESRVDWRRLGAGRGIRRVLSFRSCPVCVVSFQHGDNH